LTVKENGAKRGKQITLSSVDVLNEYVIFSNYLHPIAIVLDVSSNTIFHRAASAKGFDKKNILQHL
jgi:hypothetical protein